MFMEPVRDYFEQYTQTVSISDVKFVDNTIRDKNELNNHINYIHYNPVKHKLVQNVKDWEYSSFHKYVKKGLYDINWGNNTDIKEIIDLDFE